MTDSHAKVCLVIHVVGELIGRTKLQKIVYIAQRLGYPFLESFSWREYGPFSPALAAEVEELKELGILEEEPTREWGYVSWKYRLTELGEQFLDVIPATVPEPEGLARLVRELHQKRSARALELIASILYMEELGYGRETALRKVRRAKPKYTGSAKEVLQALEDLEVLTEHFRSPRC